MQASHARGKLTALGIAYQHPWLMAREPSLDANRTRMSRLAVGYLSEARIIQLRAQCLESDTVASIANDRSGSTRASQLLSDNESMEFDVVSLFIVVAMAAWIWSKGTDQAGRLFDRRGPDAAVWYWLRALSVERTRDNCTRFANVVQLSGIALLALLLASWLMRK
jgi:hypothetical protein